MIIMKLAFKYNLQRSEMRGFFRIYIIYLFCNIFYFTHLQFQSWLYVYLQRAPNSNVCVWTTFGCPKQKQ